MRSLPSKVNYSAIFFLTLANVASSACTHTAKKSRQETVPPKADVVVVDTPSPLAPPTPIPPEEAPLVAAAPAPSAPASSPDCLVVPIFPGDEPVFLPKTKVMLTRMSGPCTTPTGEAGHLPSSGWMVMGFPCTGGEGRIDWKGTNYFAPKMVSFLLDTNCPMAPLDQNTLKQSVIAEAGLSPRSSLVAFNPFVIQYWEVLDYQDADSTFSVDLRIGKSLTTGWNAFIKQTPYKVLLVGRENAWVPGNHMYVVEAEIHGTSKNRFKLAVQTARILKGEELTTIKARCESLKPARDCGKVF